MQIELGKQWVFGNKFLLDTYWGLGYGFDNKESDNDEYNFNNSEAFNYINARTGKSPGLSLTYGVKIGWLIK